MIRFDNRAVPIVLAAVTIDVIGFGIVMPVLTELITRLGHVDLPQATRIAGWMLAAFALAQFVAGPVLGNLGDRFGRRPVLIAAMVGFSLDYLLMSVAPTLAWLFLGRVIAGVAGATYGPAGAVIADVTVPEKRAQTFGLLGAAFGIGFIVGPALGGVVASLGPRAPFVVAAALAALNALAMLLFLPETLGNENRRPPASRCARHRRVQAAVRRGQRHAFARRVVPLAAGAQRLPGDVELLGNDPLRLDPT